MQSMTTDQIRQAYLEFFRSKGHAVIPGAPLVPENDPTVLFTTAGMHPLVPYLLGEPHPAGKRVADVQRCVRTGDIDEVGDASHLTMFEMLGNWSFGDYFKEEAISMSYEFLMDVLKIDPQKFAVTCFAGDSDAPKDEESAAIWESLGVPRERIGFLPKAKNWWGPAGQTGPCGPDTEMFYWVGPGELPPAGSNPANDEDNWLEIWNDVFMQYNKKEDGTFEPLAQKNVDTGMGLERIAAVLQGVRSVYDTDAMKPIIAKIFEFSRIRPEDKKSDLSRRSARIVTDHLRASIFIIADGIIPSNVDQGYVLRRLIRRAIRSARQIDAFTPEFSFLSRLTHTIIDQYKDVYSFLQEKRSGIYSVILDEEQKFLRTLEAGERHFERVATGNIDGQTAFHLYDTYGFPIELTKELAAERNLTMDEEGFKKAFEEHQAKSRAGAEQKFKGGLADHSAETTKLHTATHLLNAALRKVLGDHVSQKGSNITAERLRFDFNHPDKMTPEQIKEVERLVNEAIDADLPVSYHLTTVEGAKQEGAIGVFDDRYASEVKVYVMGSASSGGQPFSKEICGGPHVARTKMLGRFKIQKEESSSAGVRRIKAVVEGGPAEIEAAGEG